MKSIYFTGVLILTFTMSFAQLNFGVKGGLNLSNLHRNESGNADEWKPGVHAGPWMSYDFTKRFTIINDLLYSEKGFSSGEFKAYFSYISFLTNIRYNLIRKFSVEVGGGPSRLVSSYVKNNGRHIWGNKMDWELCTGIHYKLNSKIALALRYEHGLSNVVHEDAVPHHKPISHMTIY
jgi:hypothetical protein